MRLAPGSGSASSRRVPRLLTAEEEAALASRIHGPDDRDALLAATELVARNLGLVGLMLRGERSQDFGDLYAEGVIGLHKAAASYDPIGHPGVRFGAYARHHIKAAILRARLRLWGWTERDATLERRGQEEACSDRDRASLERRRRARRMRSLWDRDGRLRAEPATWDVPPVDRWSTAPSSGALHAAIAALPRVERAVIRGHWFGGLTLREIGEKLGYAKDRVRRIEQRALERLRDRLVG